MPDTKRRWLCAGSIPDRVVQILETDGGWFTVAAIHYEYEQRFSPVDKGVIDRAVHRVCRAGYAEKRLTEHVDYSAQHPGGNFIRRQLHIRANTRVAT